MNADLDKFKFARNSHTYLRKLPTIPPSRPCPLVRSGKTAISACSVVLHGEKYYILL